MRLRIPGWHELLDKIFNNVTSLSDSYEIYYVIISKSTWKWHQNDWTNNI